MNLAYDRHEQLEQTLVGLGFSKMPTESEDITRVQVQAAKDIGGIRTRMLLDASSEIEKYHFGPLQMSLCLLLAIFEEYARLTKINAVFSDDKLDAFQQRNHQILQSLKELRNSILHERYDNIDAQKQLVSSYANGLVEFAIKAEQKFQSYLNLLKNRLLGDD